MFSGIYHSAIIFFLGYYQFAFGGHAFESGLDGDLVQFGILTFFVLVIITNVRAGMIALNWTWLMPISLIFSIFSFVIVAFFIGTSASLILPSRSTSSFLSLMIVSVILPCLPCPFLSYPLSPPLIFASSPSGAIGLSLGVLGGSFYLALASSMTSARFWLCGIITIFSCLVRDYAWRAHVRLHDPSEVTKRQASACFCVAISSRSGDVDNGADGISCDCSCLTPGIR
jgi:hypothetical protein